MVSFVIALFPLAGVAMVIGGLVLHRRLKRRVVGFKQTVAIVIDHAPLRSGLDTDPTYRPVVEYHVDGERFTITGDVGHGEKKEEGTGLMIWYDSTNPARAVIAQNYYILVHILWGIGGVFILLGGLIAWHFFSGNGAT